MKAIVGKKIGMTQIYNKETAKASPATVIDVSESVVARNITSQGVVTHVEYGFGKKKHPLRAQIGQYKELAYVPQVTFTAKLGHEQEVKPGKVDISVFEVGDTVKVTGTSKGKGFSGVMKRWNFKGGKRTHGQSDRERAPGSIGSGTTPGRVLKGKKMPGRMGRDKVTIIGSKILHVDADKGVIVVSGTVPGFNNKSHVFIRTA